MRVVKKYLLLSMLLIFYVSVISILLQQVYRYQRAYEALSTLIAHPNIEPTQADYVYEEKEE